MKILKWYSLVVVSLSCLGLILEMIAMEYIESASGLGLAMYLPVLAYLILQVKEK
jgi:hypothetical protein